MARKRDTQDHQLKCCGRSLITPFCPMCGKNTGAYELAGLIAHAEAQVAKVGLRAAGRQTHALGADRWKAWFELLLKLDEKLNGA